MSYIDPTIIWGNVFAKLILPSNSIYQIRSQNEAENWQPWKINAIISAWKHAHNDNVNMPKFSRCNVYCRCVRAWPLKLVFNTLLAMIWCLYQIQSWPSMTANTFLHISHRWSCLGWWTTSPPWLHGMNTDKIQLCSSAVCVFEERRTLSV